MFCIQIAKGMSGDQIDGNCRARAIVGDLSCWLIWNKNIRLPF